MKGPRAMADTTALIADIGGTNARFAVADETGAILAAETLAVAEHPSFTEAIEFFLGRAGFAPARASLAVAGPVSAGVADFTNSSWTVDRDRLAATFGWREAHVINDFEALALYALDAPATDLVRIKEGEADPTAPVLVLGPGTGLGQSIAVPSPDHSIAIATEGGHAVMAAINGDEAALLERISRHLGRPTTVEDVVSGSGLARIFAGLNDGFAAMPEPAAVTARALEGDRAAMAATTQFLAFLATAAGNGALGTGARGGVMIAGGVAPRLLPLLDSDAFARRLIGESPMAAYLRAIPVDVLVGDGPALRGAFRRFAVPRA